ncbi:MAG: PD40 domain-containing protein [Acidobacteria bacterium]|nr:PD40 domain-containing protein [Acidobacteriota bacterium]
MPPAVPSEPRGYAFGPFVLDRVKRRLLRDGQPVPVTSKTLDVLLVLVARRDRIVPKDELLELVWGDRIVEENNLFRQISRVRKALDERPDEHRYIVTLPNEGYRFVADVSEWSEALQAEPAAEARPDAPDVVEDQREPAAASLPASAPPPVRRYGLAAGLLAIVGLVLALLVFGPRTTASRAAASPPVLTQITFDPGFSRQPAWSPTGQAVVFVSDRSGNPDLWIKRLDDGSLVQASSTPWAESTPSWSPDGKQLAYRSSRDGGGIYVTDVGGSSERRIATFGYAPQWSPDGAVILFSSRPGGPSVGPVSLFIVGLDGQPPRPARPDITKLVEPVGAAWHPDGRLSILGRDDVGFVLATAPPFEGTPVMSLHQQAFQDALRRQRVEFGRFRWAPPGNAIYLEGTTGGVANIWRIPIDPATNEATGGPERVTIGVGADVNMAVARDGRLMFTTRTSRSRMWAFRFDPAVGRLLDGGTPLTSGVPGELNADASNDGKEIAYSIVRGDQHEVWTRRLDQGADTLLFKGTGGTFSKPRWSADDRHVVLSRRWTAPEGGSAKVELIQVSPASKAVRVVPLDDQQYFVPSDLAADGRTILGACQQQAGDPVKLCAARLSADAKAVAVTVLAADPVRELRNAHFSPDHRWILFQALDRRPQGTSSLYVMPASGGTWVAISSGGSFDDKPRWSPDGRTVYYVSDRNGGFRNLWGRRFDGTAGLPSGDPFPVTAFTSDERTISGDARNMDIALTSTRLLLPITESTGQLWMLESSAP